jgi:hypothetical protein
LLTLKRFHYSLPACSLFVWLVADGWCWFVLREKYCWLVAGGWFILREKYCWLVADKPSEQGVGRGLRFVGAWCVVPGACCVHQMQLAGGY